VVFFICHIKKINARSEIEKLESNITIFFVDFLFIRIEDINNKATAGIIYFNLNVNNNKI